MDSRRISVTPFVMSKNYHYMKKIIITAISLLTLAACTKKSTTTSPPVGTGSTFNITFNGKTYHETTAGTATNVMSGMTTSVATTGDYTGQVVVQTKNIRCGLMGWKHDLSSALGIYHIMDIYTIPAEFIDLGDGGKQYANDTNSTVTIAVSTGTQCKGTFNLILHYNGATYPATGDFDIKK